MSSPNQQQTFKSIIGGAIGNLVEWYDWFSYAVFSIYFAPAFFPDDDFTMQLLKTAGIFSIGFLMRPMGGWLFGRYADQVGRKKALTFSVFLMCSGSLLIAFAPTYHTIGIYAPFLLLFARMLQGLSIGGEDGSVATYLAEVAPPNRRGFYASFQAVTISMGQVIALIILISLQYFLLTTQQLESWGMAHSFFYRRIISDCRLLFTYQFKRISYFLRLRKHKPQIVAV